MPLLTLKRFRYSQPALSCTDLLWSNRHISQTIHTTIDQLRCELWEKNKINTDFILLSKWKMPIFDKVKVENRQEWKVYLKYKLLWRNDVKKREPFWHSKHCFANSITFSIFGSKSGSLSLSSAKNAVGSFSFFTETIFEAKNENDFTESAKSPSCGA